jgi:hypothetical protein
LNWCSNTAEVETDGEFCEPSQFPEGDFSELAVLVSATASEAIRYIVINGTDYTLFKDYDKGKYRHLAFPGKIQYLKARVDLIVLNPCKLANRTALQSNLGLILVTGICAAISAAGTFLKGQRAPRGSDEKYFSDFVTNYMAPILQRRQRVGVSQTWVKWLYRDLRCGLSHNFTVETGGIEYQVPKYIVVRRRHGPEINPRHLLRDFEQGFCKYLKDVASDGPGKGLGRLFENRFDQIFHD